ncbi:MAG: hypothetical protein ABJF04_07075 [Reichenbachiella sp.]|uniref:hypothetical protein n=2 Tax=Reichenbachiella sp. TaxID=2184521 RepID=UPI0032662E68
MKEMPIKGFYKRLFGVAFLTFLLNKFYLRPWVVEKELADFWQIIVFSLPNFIEAAMGTLILTGVFLQLRVYRNMVLRDIHIYWMAVGATAVYVISQELKFHNLGGNNVYDPYDLLASIIGLVATFIVLQIVDFTDLQNNEHHK